MEIEKKLTGKFKPYFKHTVEQFAAWLAKQGYQFNYSENASGDATITVKFEYDGQYEQAARKAEEIEAGNDPQTSLDLGDGPEWPEGEYKGTVKEISAEYNVDPRAVIAAKLMAPPAGAADVVHF
jgi:hypothetical protein